MRKDDTHASSIFGFASLESNGAALERLVKALPGKPALPESSSGCLRVPASDLTLASGCTKFSGISVVCTGVTPPKAALPPQNALAADAARRGDDGRSFWVFGVTSEELAGVRVARRPGGGSAGESARPAEARRAFLSALISCLNAAFSDWLEPSSVRMASMRRSRSAISPSSVVMYSSGALLVTVVTETDYLTLAAHSEVTSTDFVTKLTLFFA